MLSLYISFYLQFLSLVERPAWLDRQTLSLDSQGAGGCTWHKSPSGVVVGVAPGEVYPLWVTKLISHEVEV